jgi:hypothetical protein
MLVVDDNPCGVLTNDAFSPNQDCWTAATVGNGVYANLAVGPTEPDYFELTVLGGEVAVIQAVTDSFPLPLELAIYTPSSCPNPTVGNCAGSLACGQVISPNTTQLLWSNPSSTPAQIKLRVIPPLGTTCLSYTLLLGGLDGGSTSMGCTPAMPNSSGLPCTLLTSSFSGPELYHLEAVNGPVGEFGYFLVSGNLVSSGITVSNGLLCLGHPIGRYNYIAGINNFKRNSLGQFNGQGVLINQASTSSLGSGFDVPTQLPFPPDGLITGGQTWYFQLWFRDGADSNFSDVVGVTF